MVLFIRREHLSSYTITQSQVECRHHDVIHSVKLVQLDAEPASELGCCVRMCSPEASVAGVNPHVESERSLCQQRCRVEFNACRQAAIDLIFRASARHHICRVCLEVEVELRPSLNLHDLHRRSGRRICKRRPFHSDHVSEQIAVVVA